MTKLYVINDTPLFGVSRKDRRAALRREQSGENVRRPELEGAEGYDGPPPLPPREPVENPIVEAILPSTTAPRNASAESRSVWGMPAAYLLGPLLVARWTRGNTRMLWTTIGAVSLAAAAVIAVRWTPFLGWAADTEHGSVAWLATLTIVCLAIFATWSRAIAAAAERHPAPLHHRFRDARLAFVLGLLVPGLGHYLARKPRVAAGAFRLLGPLTAAVIVLANGRWLWALHRAGSPGAMDPLVLEAVFASAAALTVALLGAWLGQAVHGSRLAAEDPHAGRQGRLVVASLAAIVLGVTLVAKQPLAGSLHDASARLQGKGLRLIPLCLTDTAVRLDAGQPDYLVELVSLNEALGRAAAAREARATLRERAGAFASASREAAIPVVLTANDSDGVSAWGRLQALTP
jgi:hypothetical protein